MNYWDDTFKKALRLARRAAGFRENFAMDRGGSEIVQINGHDCIKFTYSPDHEYQDANGATFDTVLCRWIN